MKKHTKLLLVSVASFILSFITANMYAAYPAIQAWYFGFSGLMALCGIICLFMSFTLFLKGYD